MKLLIAGEPVGTIATRGTAWECRRLTEMRTILEEAFLSRRLAPIVRIALCVGKWVLTKVNDCFLPEKGGDDCRVAAVAAARAFWKTQDWPCVHQNNTISSILDPTNLPQQ